MAEITEPLCGLEITSSQVSRATAELDAQIEGWRNRELGEAPYLVIDARYGKVRYGGSVVDCAGAHRHRGSQGGQTLGAGD